MWTPAARAELARASLPYATCLTEANWVVVAPLVPAPATTGRPRLWLLRSVLDAILYVLRTGCAWRHLPRDFPQWSTVHRWFLRLSEAGVFECLAHASQWRTASGPDAKPARAAPSSTPRPRDLAAWASKVRAATIRRAVLLGASATRSRTQTVACSWPQCRAPTCTTAAVASYCCAPRVVPGPSSPLLRRPSLSRRARRDRHAHHCRDRQAAQRSEGLCRPAQALDSRTHLRLDQPLPQACPRS